MCYIPDNKGPNLHINSNSPPSRLDSLGQEAQRLTYPLSPLGETKKKFEDTFKVPTDFMIGYNLGEPVRSYENSLNVSDVLRDALFSEN